MPANGGSSGTTRSATRPEEAHVFLLERLYQRMEASLLGEGLLALERRASRWWFSRWSLHGGGEAMEFGRCVREQEWSLVDRPCVMPGVPVLTAFLEQGFADSFATPPRQRRMAEALCESTVGAFVVRERGEGSAVLEDPHAGRRFRIREHNRELEYGPGCLALGRVMPFEEGSFLRSPGMAFLGGGEGMEEMARPVAAGLAERREALPAAIGLEGLISVLSLDMRGRRKRKKRPEVPRRVRPAPSRAAARETLRNAIAVLEEEGQADAVSTEAGARELAVPEGFEDVRYLKLHVDEVLAEWLTALRRQAGGTAAHSGPSPAAAKRKSRKKSKKKRR